MPHRGLPMIRHASASVPPSRRKTRDRRVGAWPTITTSTHRSQTAKRHPCRTPSDLSLPGRRTWGPPYALRPLSTAMRIPKPKQMTEAIHAPTGKSNTVANNASRNAANESLKYASTTPHGTMPAKASAPHLANTDHPTGKACLARQTGQCAVIGSPILGRNCQGSNTGTPSQPAVPQGYENIRLSKPCIRIRAEAAGDDRWPRNAVLPRLMGSGPQHGTPSNIVFAQAATQGGGERSEPHRTRIRRRTLKSKRPHFGDRCCLALEVGAGVTSNGGVRCAHRPPTMHRTSPPYALMDWQRSDAAFEFREGKAFGVRAFRSSR